MKIRKATIDDLESIEAVFQYAREFMKQNGNPKQWGDHRPTQESIQKVLAKGELYVAEEDGKIGGVFEFFIREDPTYQVIEDGAWISEEPYAVIHKVAGNGSIKGLLGMILAYCEGFMQHIRMDTHEDNKVMQHLLEKYGFQKCGMIYTDDGTQRLAYEKV